MSYPQGYLYQAPGSLALYSCPAYGASALAAPRSEELARSASGSAFSPYPGSAAFTAQAATGFGSPLQYSADAAAAAAAGFPSYMVTALGRWLGDPPPRPWLGLRGVMGTGHGRRLGSHQHPPLRETTTGVTLSGCGLISPKTVRGATPPGPGPLVISNPRLQIAGAAESARWSPARF